MKKYRLLLLDANIVIELSELSLWDAVVERCEVLLARTVLEQEVRYYHGQHADVQIDLAAYVTDGRIKVVEATTDQVKRFRDQFDPTYLERLDPGETESLTFLCLSADLCQICSSDAIVYRVLARLEREEQGISLEEVLQGCGLGRSLPRQYSKAFREEWTRRGQQERIRGTGLKKT
jgi:hypothetical protein